MTHTNEDLAFCHVQTCAEAAQQKLVAQVRWLPPPLPTYKSLRYGMWRDSYY